MNVRRRAVVAALVAAAAAPLASCSGADPAAVAAVGLDSTGYVGVVVMCDRGRTVTYVDFTAAGDDTPTLAWIGRTVEPITLFRLSEEPPDNWVVDVEGGLIADIPYLFQATADDLTVFGPEVTLADLNTLSTDEVIDASGVVRSMETFLDTGCEA